MPGSTHTGLTSSGLLPGLDACRDSTKAGASGSRGSSGAAGMAVLAAAAEAARRQARSSKPGRAGSGGEAPSSSSSGSGLTYDMETAFRVLRSAGYSGHALSVAERAGQPEWVLDVLLEDMGSYAEAVAFIGEGQGEGGVRIARAWRARGHGLRIMVMRHLLLLCPPTHGPAHICLTDGTTTTTTIHVATLSRRRCSARSLARMQACCRAAKRPACWLATASC